MFDDPNKALRRMQEQLLAAEEPEIDIFAPVSPELTEPETEAMPRRAEAPENQRRNKIMMLVALLLLEAAAMLAVLAWWLLW